MKKFSLACMVLLLAMASICYPAEYRLFNDNFLTVGNEWHYDMHITIMDNQSVDLSGTADITVTGTADIGSYTNVPVFTYVTSGNDYDSYYYLTPDYILDLGTEYLGGNLHEEYYNDNPLEMYPVWVDTSHDDHHFGSGDISVTQDDPAYTWTESHDTYVTFLKNETISVPAGPFDCVTIYILTEWTDSDGFYGYEQETISFDPHIGIISVSAYDWSWDNFSETSSIDEYYYELSSTNVLPQTYCKARSLPMDFDNDCQVGLTDFAMFVQSWMDCQLDPSEACGGTPTSDLPSPIAHWRLDDNANNMQVSGGSSNIYAGTASANTDTFSDASAIKGRSFKFNGSTIYIDTGEPFQEMLRESFTVSMWIKPKDGRPNPSQSIIGSRDKAGPNSLIKLTLTQSTGVLTFQYNSEEQNSLIASSLSGLSDGQEAWHHVVFVVTKNGTGATAQVYLDGIAGALISESGVGMSSYGSLDNIAIGAWNDDGVIGQYFAGNIDDVKIFNKGLTANEVQMIYNE